LTHAEQHIAKGDKHIKWQREVVDILERISTSAEATEGARALLTAFLEAQAQHQQIRDRIRASLYGNTDPPSTMPLPPLEAQAQHEQDHGHGRIFVSLAKSDSCSTVPPTLFEAHAQPKLDGDQIHLSPDCNLGSSSTVPRGQSIDNRNDLEVQAQREQDGDEIRLGLNCNVDSPSTIPLERPVDHQNKLIGLGDIVGTCVDRAAVQFGAKPEHVWWIVRAAAAWISDLVRRAGSKSRN
jgi:hypothetical protein